MHRTAAPLRVLLLAAVLLAPALARADAPEAALVLSDDGGLDVPTQKALRGLAIGELRKRGVNVSDDRFFEGVRAPDAALAEALRAVGVRRLFALRVNGRLGQKLPLSLEELTPDAFAPVYSSALTAATLEESDVIVPRLVDAVLDRGSAENNAKLRSVTAAEARPYLKKPGERFWVIGLPVALFAGQSSSSLLGFSLGYMYEGDNFHVGIAGEVAENKSLNASSITIDGAWVPFDGELSPYLGAGMGYMSANSTGGMGVKLEAGLEAFRLHGLRLMVGLDLLIPFFDSRVQGYSSGSTGNVIYPAAHLRLAF